MEMHDLQKSVARPAAGCGLRGSKSLGVEEE